MTRGVILGRAAGDREPSSPPPVTIRRATCDDLIYVLKNLRPRDHAEANAMFPGAAYGALAQSCSAGWAWAIELHGNPVACFGYVKRSAHVVEGWSFGTDAMTRCIPAMTRYIREELPKLWLAEDVHVVEVRAMKGDSPNHAWLKSLGFRSLCFLHDQGANGETFILYTWGRPYVAA